MTDELEHLCPCSKFNVGNKGLVRNKVCVFAQKSMNQTKEQNAGGPNIKSHKKTHLHLVIMIHYDIMTEA